MKTSEKTSRLRELTEEFERLERKLKLGGGAEKIEKIHKQGKLTARERIDLLFDKDEYQQEIGLLVAYDEYKGQAPAAAVVTSIGKVNGRECVVVANDATIKAGAWYPETIKKILRAQEIAMRNRVPIVYLVDSAGVNLPYQGGVFPGQYGAARIFYYNSIMRRYLKVPQISAVMGMCVAGGAYLPALSDVILMVEGTSFMGLGGANLVKGATGQTIDNETLGGALTHNAISGVAHYRTKDEAECLDKIRRLISELPKKEETKVSIVEAVKPANKPERLLEVLPEDHRAPYDMREVLNCFLDGGEFDEFQADYAKEMICGTARINGILVGVIANSRGMVKAKPGNPPKFGGIVYTESAEKTAYFIENCNRHSTPLLFVQDVSGFMVGAEAEHSGIIRAGARFVEAMATATVPKIVLTINHASGAGYYAMAGQGFDPDFIFSLPTGRMGVMEGDSAAQAIFGTQIEKLKKEGKEPDEALKAEMQNVRDTYERELDAKHAAARGLVDAIVTPKNLSDALTLALQTCLNTDKPHLGAFVLPSGI
ncbi:MAG: Acetyl-CoA carboxylase, carboxyltransferase component (subunit alpha and beta) [Acidobacteria bacterium]|jgi:3-methylcrotonyl-CoA carboxylase beta subunit|nr:Acetyl-CoA carboxylase, carboxyltransferase component (subunit alpha and beta) [Acidobacteriota bacterium]